MQPIDTPHIPSKFEPSLAQVQFAKVYVQTAGNVSESFKILCRDRSAYYDVWTKQEGFAQWLSNYAKQQVLSRAGKWYLILEKHADAGSFNHLDRLMEIGKEFLKDNQKSPVTVNVFPSKTIVFSGIDEIRNKQTRIPDVYATEGEGGSVVREEISSS